ncbi:MAG: hypothetical protein FWD52_02210 [Candidatus Bathyarchaeota archaeon]|nr:hypothetical protein [Candidatus Termiticorpusculum sp.]
MAVNVKSKPALNCLFGKKTLVFVSLLFMLVLVSSPFVFGTNDWIVINVDVCDEVELREAISTAPGNAWHMIGVGQDIVLKESLVIPKGKMIGLVGDGRLVGGDGVDTIIVKRGGELQLWGVVVTHVEGGGGRGVYVERGGIFSLCSGTISGNSADKGGGVYNKGSFTMWGGIVDTHCVISGNTATQGGGVYNEGTFIMNNNGGIYDNRCMDAGNSVGLGGGVYNKGTFTMNDGYISSNVASKGGGVYNKGTFAMSGRIHGNVATSKGGGVYNEGSFDVKGDVRYGDATFAVYGSISYNVVGTEGGGVYGNRLFDVYGDWAINSNEAAGSDSDRDVFIDKNVWQFYLLTIIFVVLFVVGGLFFYRLRRQKQLSAKGVVDSKVVSGFSLTSKRPKKLDYNKRAQHYPLFSTLTQKLFLKKMVTMKCLNKMYEVHEK